MNKKIYLDNAATTAVRKEVIQAIIPYFEEQWFNPSAIYTSARAVRRAVEKARKQVATAINADPEEIFFTSGGSEADNWAIKSYCMNAPWDKVVFTTPIEHHALLNCCKQVATFQGTNIVYFEIDRNGRVELPRWNTAVGNQHLWSVMMVNNEIGTIQPIKELCEVAHACGDLFHTDAVQAVGNIPIDVKALGVDMLSMSGHKFGAPKGVGALYVKKGTKLFPLINGGSQEREKRGGTENVPGIIGMGVAIELASKELEEHMQKMHQLRERLLTQVFNLIPDVKVNGDPDHMADNIVSLTLKGVDVQTLILKLDFEGIECSGGSACNSSELEPSHVLKAIGLSDDEAQSTIRISFGRDTTEEDVDTLVSKMHVIVENLRFNGGVLV